MDPPYGGGDDALSSRTHLEINDGQSVACLLLGYHVDGHARLPPRFPCHRGDGACGNEKGCPSRSWRQEGGGKGGRAHMGHRTGEGRAMFTRREDFPVGDCVGPKAACVCVCVCVWLILS